MTLARPSLQQMRDELRVSQEFLSRYNRPGPRYTSYPTAPVWNDDFGPADLERIEVLFGVTLDPFQFAPDSEIGIEVDPRVTSRQHLETLRKLGFNRLSMGIQDFHPDVQKAIHRIQPFEMTRDLLFAARELG